MRKTILIIPFVVLLMATMACGFNFDFNLPNIQTIETGPTVTEDISIPYPTSEEPHLEIAFGAGVLDISPGSGDFLVEGVATYNVPELNPQVVEEGRTIRLQQGDGNLEGIPTFGRDLKMEWELELGTAPMELTINGGANQANVDLGGLAITDLTINQGASDSTFGFSGPNEAEMDSFRINAGAANLNLEGLVHANVQDEIVFKGGAGNYTLDFAGNLEQDLFVTIDAGLGNIILVVPEGTQAVVTLEGALTNVNTSGDWSKSGNEFTNDGSGSMIRIRVTMGAGNLELRN